MTDRLVDAGAGAPGVSLRPLRVARLVTLATIALLVFGAASASALQTHVFSSSFGNSGSGAGQVSSPSGVAINVTTHDVYVADTANLRVDQFSSAGSFIRAWGWGVADGLPSLEICTLSCQAGIPGTGAGQFTTPTFIAVDNSAGASAGDVYVGDTATNQVQKFTASGSLITAWGSGGKLDGTTATDGPFGALAGIAVDTTGNLNVFDTSTRLFRFAQDGLFITDLTTARGTSANGLAVDAANNFFKVNGDLSVEEFQADGTDTGQVTASNATTGIATDSATGDLYVDTGAAIEHYSFPACVPAFFSGCTPADTFASGHLAAGAGLAVDPTTGTIFVADAGNQQISVFGPVIFPDATTAAADAVAKHTATLNGHVDPAGGGAVSACAFEITDDATFQAQGYAGASTVACDQPTPIAAAADVTAAATGLVAATTYHFRLLATDAQGTAQGQDQTLTTSPAVDLTIGAADPISSISATLNGHVDSTGSGDITACHFDYTDDATFQTSGFTGAQTQPCTPATPISASSDVSAAITGLLPDTTYHARLVATDTDGTTITTDQAFTTLALPSITVTAATELTTTEANLTAKINPRGADTTYRFQYGTDTSYGTSVPNPAAGIGDGTTDVSVSEHLTGLSPNTTYHYRLVATSANGTTTGPDHTFIYDTTGQGLPDGRGYEMVTPTQKNGTLVGAALFSLPPELSDDGSSLSLVATQCFAGAGSCPVFRGNIGTPFSFERTAGGWQPTSLAPSATQFDSSTGVQLSSEAGAGLFRAPTSPGGEDDFYARRPDGSFVNIGPSTPPAAGTTPPDLIQPGVSAATADLSHLAWATDHPIWPFDATDASSSSAYQYAGIGNVQPLLLGVSGGPGSTDLISTCGTFLGSSPNSTYPGTMSVDGRTVYFTAQSQPNTGGQSTPCPGGSGANASIPVPADTLYARVDGSLPTAHSVSISERSPLDCTTSACTSSTPAIAYFLGASAEGSRAFFTSTQQLTDDASQDPVAADQAGSTACARRITGPNGCNLYLYDFSRPAGHQLVDVSAGDSSGSGPQVQGMLGFSSDGSHAYFVAKGVLTAAGNAQGQRARLGAENLYVYDADSGQTAFIAALSDNALDVQQWVNSGLQSANVTPSGRFLVFTSHDQLTPDDSSTPAAAQVFRYDASTGELIRISIGDKGYNDNGNSSTTDCGQGNICSEDASIVRPHVGRAGPARIDPTMSDDGSYVLFQSPLALTPGALDRARIADEAGSPVYALNVYAYHAGRVSLISDGRDTASGHLSPCFTASGGISAVCLIGASTSGHDVFFSTADQLVPTDTDTQVDYYDARVGGGFPYTPPPESCSGDSCHGAAESQPTTPAAASVTFSGPGNATPPATPVKVKVLSTVVHGSRFLVAVRVPGKGRITISGSGIKPVGRSVGKAGTYKVRVALTAKAGRALKRKHKLKLRPRVVFAPAGGPSSSATVSLTVKA
ncbi:hypothetical protein [Baekduia sp.]|jgi:hypothetical protein|uniref:hypothetical protein n=1 Tax=Baekduia sp. TaxID=2600305 RepID=UPI002DFE93AE|nr:hypothetical protein [Baekduia sp.]